jgi:hypothetical protein
MPYTPPRPTPIYRIMHVDNLPVVIGCGYLLCENRRQQAGDWRSIAHENIQQRRRAQPVPCGLGGTVNDYVPWYFAPRSPMLYAHHKSSVPGNSDGQKVIIYLRSTIETVVRAGLPFVFTDGHGIMFNSSFYHDLGDLDKIDWPLMQSRYWNATNGDPDRPRRRQAEFLVHQRCPWTLVEEVVVYDRERLADVQSGLQGAVHRPNVRIDTSWYF